jgi:SHS family lactate transporter-like MFS transporter
LGHAVRRLSRLVARRLHYFLVVFCLTAIGKEFHKSDASVAFALLLTLALRLFGIGMGGEWGVGASLAMEKIPVKWRGVLSGLLQQGYSLGSVLAALCYLFLFNKWGWRPMFFLGGLPALLAIFVRLRVKESEVWKDRNVRTGASLAAVSPRIGSSFSTSRS